MQKPQPAPSSPLTHLLSFGLSSEQCELLLAFESTGSLTLLAELMSRDISVISRQLQKLAQTAPVLEKTEGKWRLTTIGKQMNHWTREAAQAQKQILKQQTVLKIASTREFAARILAPSLKSLLEGQPETTVWIVTSEEGVEKLILSGDVDIGFDCGRPTDPSIRFKVVQQEAFSVVVSPQFIKAHGIGKGAIDPSMLVDLPHLQYKRMSAPRLLQLTYEVAHTLATFNDIAAIREAAVAGLGWAVLPTYSVKRELDSGLLKSLQGWKIQDEQFGVWWTRGRSSIDQWVQHSVKWLKEQSLS